MAAEVRPNRKGRLCRCGHRVVDHRRSSDTSVKPAECGVPTCPCFGYRGRARLRSAEHSRRIAEALRGRRKGPYGH